MGINFTFLIKPFGSYFFLILYCFIPSFSFSHGDLHARIQEVSIQIKANPDSSYLYFKRGKLYFQHEEYDKALSDLDTSNDLGYYGKNLDLQYGLVYKKLNYPNKALKHVDRILEKDPKYVKAWNLQGHIYFETNNYSEAAKSFEQVLLQTSETLPENYMNLSICYQLMNSRNSLIEAVQVLLKGIEDLGPLMTFYERIVGLYIQESEFKQAIVYQNKIVELSNRKEKALFERGKIHLLNKNITAAKIDFLEAKNAINALPLNIRLNSAMKTLTSKINDKIKKL